MVDDQMTFHFAFRFEDSVHGFWTLNCIISGQFPTQLQYFSEIASISNLNNSKSARNSSKKWDAKVQERHTVYKFEILGYHLA